METEMRCYATVLFFALFCLLPNLSLAQRQYGFDNRKPSGQPYLKPEETAKQFKMSPGYEAKLFAGEPDVINPVAFTIDERGRIWVVECFEYPKRTPKGKKPRDRIKILEDTNGDGRCDKVTIFAEGKDLPIGWDLATGIEVGHGGVFLGAAPYLFFLEDTNGDDKCDKQTVLLKGFGSQDTHETLNTLQWGPDCQLYGLHGVFTHSEVDGVRMNAAVWRYDPHAKEFAIFAEGTSNPWGMDFDARGQCHLVCCVIPHMFHIVPGGTYIRQAGASFNPHAYGLLPQSCDHTHHKESGWAHAGLLFMEGDHVPKSYEGSLLMGSIHGCSIKRDTLHADGSTFRASHAADFAVSGDKNFRPINLRWGPDGSIYVIDWHDQNPCHQALPDSWDMERGRIYRLVRKDAKAQKAPDFSKKSNQELVASLANDNPYVYRTAIRLLHERKAKNAKAAILQAIESAKSTPHTLRLIWALHAIGEFDHAATHNFLQHEDEHVRGWAVRFLSQTDAAQKAPANLLREFAEKEKSAKVRLELASAAQHLKKEQALAVLQGLMTHKSDVADRFLPLMIWLAYEPNVVPEKTSALPWLRANAKNNPLIIREIVPRTMRRLVATGKSEDLSACLAFLADVDSEVRRQAMDGMLIALKGKTLQPPLIWNSVFPQLTADDDAEVRKLARRLAVHFQDEKAIAVALKTLTTPGRSTEDALEAIRNLSVVAPDNAQSALVSVVTNPKEAIGLRLEACRALGGYADAKIANAILKGWKGYPQQLKDDVINLLSSRRDWSHDLLNAVKAKVVSGKELSNNTILRIQAFGDENLNKAIETVWGSFRPTPEKLTMLLNEMFDEMDREAGSFARGRTIFTNNCGKCHKFEGMGHEVGPNLDGASREIDYLIANILDPNRVVGEPYFTRLVELKNGRIETGLLHSENEESITLKGENDALKVILKKDIDGKILIQKKSVMPEGLANNMTKQDFRDLVRYLMAHPFLTDVAIHGPVHNPNDPTPTADNWKKVRVPVTGQIILPVAKSHHGKNYVVRMTFSSKRAFNSELLLGIGQAADLWINGKKVATRLQGSQPVRPDQLRLPIAIQEGNNEIRLFLRNVDDAPIFARIRDPQRQLIFGDSE